MNSRTLVPSAAAARATSARPTVGGQHFGAGVLEDEGRLLRFEHEIDRHQHGAEPRQRKAQAGEGVAVARQDGDPRTLADAARGKAGGQAIAQA